MTLYHRTKNKGTTHVTVEKHNGYRIPPLLLRRRIRTEWNEPNPGFEWGDPACLRTQQNQNSNLDPRPFALATIRTQGEAAMYPPFLLLLYFPLHYAGEGKRRGVFGLMRTLNRGGGWHHRRLRPHARSPEKRLSKRRRRRGGGRIWEGALCKKGRGRYDAEATKAQGMDVNDISLGGIIHHVTHIVSPGKS